MFLIAGISPKMKPLGKSGGCACPLCGAFVRFNVIHKYMTPHIFFIPTFRFHSEYTAVCPSCASVMALDPEKGRGLERGRDVSIAPSDLTILRDNARNGF